MPLIQGCPCIRGGLYGGFHCRTLVCLPSPCLSPNPYQEKKSIEEAWKILITCWSLRRCGLLTTGPRPMRPCTSSLDWLSPCTKSEGVSEPTPEQLPSYSCKGSTCEQSNSCLSVISQRRVGWEKGGPIFQTLPLTLYQKNGDILITSWEHSSSIKLC